MDDRRRNELLRAKLQQVIQFLEAAEARAAAAGDESMAKDPECNRYAAEAGSLLTTCDIATKDLNEIITWLDETSHGGEQTKAATAVPGRQ